MSFTLTPSVVTVVLTTTGGAGQRISVIEVFADVQLLCKGQAVNCLEVLCPSFYRHKLFAYIAKSILNYRKVQTILFLFGISCFFMKFQKRITKRGHVGIAMDTILLSPVYVVSLFGR